MIGPLFNAKKEAFRNPKQIEACTLRRNRNETKRTSWNCNPLLTYPTWPKQTYPPMPQCFVRIRNGSRCSSLHSWYETWHEFTTVDLSDDLGNESSSRRTVSGSSMEMSTNLGDVSRLLVVALSWSPEQTSPTASMSIYSPVRQGWNQINPDTLMCAAA